MTIAEQERERNIRKFEQSLALDIIEMMKNKDGLFIYADYLELAKKIAKKYDLEGWEL